jgi:hypothetical protein
MLLYDRFPIGAAWFDSKLGDEESDDVGEGDKAGGDVHLGKPNSRPEWFNGNIPEAIREVNVGMTDAAQTVRVPVIGKDFVHCTIEYLIGISGRNHVDRLAGGGWLVNAKIATEDKE